MSKIRSSQEAKSETVRMHLVPQCKHPGEEKNGEDNIAGGQKAQACPGNKGQEKRETIKCLVIESSSNYRDSLLANAFYEISKSGLNLEITRIRPVERKSMRRDSKLGSPSWRPREKRERT
ncbi:hypothetical protein C8J56DRAFT_899819 [Mycena floridula]|nr:hypothetical protein C8J56DRAFT_899819 [Mycena floridula]